MASGITASTCRYCYLDLDLDHHREKLATAAAFVDATDARYGLSSKDLRLLGGSELARLPAYQESDHEWSGRGAMETKSPPGGNRIVLELFWDAAPLTCENFATLASNGSVLPWHEQKKAKPAPVGSSGKQLTYRGSTMHRCKAKFVLQGGDFIMGNGSAGESIFNGKKFKDERGGLALMHDRRGVLSMGNSGKNSNTSQFFLTFDATPQCNAKHVVFGQIISGWEVLDATETYGTPEGTPTADILITDCGIYQPLQMPGAGYWYDVPDAESFSGVSPIFMVLPRVAVVAPSNAVLSKFRAVLQGSAVVTAVGGDDECQEEDAQASRILELLGVFAVDVVLVAPVLKAVIAKLQLPQSWKEQGIHHLDQVVFEAKPVDALARIQTKSWLAQRPWRLEGTNP